MLAPAGGNGRGHKCVKVSHLGSLNPGKSLLFLGKSPFHAMPSKTQYNLRSNPQCCVSASLSRSSWLVPGLAGLSCAGDWIWQ